MSDQITVGMHQGFSRAKRLAIVAVVLIAISFPLFVLNDPAVAAQITSRSLTLTSAQISTSTSYNFSLVPGTTAAIQGMKFQACTTAIGTCTAPSGLSFGSAGGGSLTGTWTNATAFTVDLAGGNDCTASASILCAKRTQASNETGAAIRGVTFTTITNPNGTSCATINCTFFVRITTYTTTTWTVGSITDTGTVAASTVQLLTVNAQVAESLTFCVGATTADTNTAAVATCGSIAGTSLNLGVLSSSFSNVSPVSAASANGDSNNGLAELSTNASTGATVTYDSIQQSGTNHQGTLRVSGASCNSGAINTDQCINTIGTSKATLAAGTENFGMAIAAINCQNVTAYTCTTSSGTTNLTRSTNYNCNATNTYTTDSGQVAGTTNCSYAWDETGAAATIATSSSVVGGEAMILKFAATPNLVTPTGSYTAKADFIATPTF